MQFPLRDDKIRRARHGVGRQPERKDRLVGVFVSFDSSPLREQHRTRDNDRGCPVFGMRVRRTRTDSVGLRLSTGRQFVPDIHLSRDISASSLHRR